MLLVHAREGLDWMDRGRVTCVSNERVTDSPLRLQFRSVCENECFGMIAARVRRSRSPVGSIPMHGGARWRMSPATCWQISTKIPRGADVQRCLTRRAHTPGTRSKLAICAAPSERWECWSGAEGHRAPIRRQLVSIDQSINHERVRSRPNRSGLAASF